MSVVRVDVVVLGSGFGGSLLSLILSQIGRQCALIDRDKHPRFAIGESSTPLADLVLSDLAKRYNLPDVLPLASFGSWQEEHSALGCGLKRGFSYFHHQEGRLFATNENNANQLLVAASSNDHDSDTHWLRADVDAFLFEQAQNNGVKCFDQTTIDSIGRADRWRIQLRDSATIIDADVIVDATGSAGELLKRLPISDDTNLLRTNSRAIFGHFDGVRPFAELLGDTGPHPYACDNAALHHVLDDGWMWNLRFTNGVVSAGIATSLPDPNTSPEAQVEQWFTRYPSIAGQFNNAKPITPLRTTGRLQRLAGTAAGEGWFALPNTAGFIDPLHSTGIAHTLSAIERIVGMFEDGMQKDAAAVEHYDNTIRNEIRYVDELVSGCYDSLGSPEHFNAWCMLYFASAHSCEMRRVRGERRFENGFLGAGLHQLREITQAVREEFDRASDPDQFIAFVEQAIEPFNEVGLFQPPVPNMYANTAPPRGLSGA